MGAEIGVAPELPFAQPKRIHLTKGARRYEMTHVQVVNNFFQRTKL